MPYRSIASATISFGLVVIPVKFYLACNSETVSFHMITKDGRRVRQTLQEEGSGREVDRSEVLKGYEYSKGQYVTFTAEEIKALEETERGSIEIQEFVPAASISALHVEKSYYIGPGKGGDKAYDLLTRVLLAREVVAVGQWMNRGRRHLVTIKATQEGLLVQQMYYSDEVRPFECSAAKTTITDAEAQMAHQLVEIMTAKSYEPEKYKDTYRERVLQAVEAKVRGEKTTPVATPPTTTLDLVSALKASLKAPEKASTKKGRGKSRSSV